MQYYYSPILANVYGSGNYNVNVYSSSSATNTSSTGSSSNNLLTDTGFNVLLVSSIACGVICVALIVKFWGRSRKKLEVENTDQDQTH